MDNVEPKMYLNQDDKVQLFYLLGILSEQLSEDSYDASSYIAELRSSHFMGDPPFYEKQAELGAYIKKIDLLHVNIRDIQNHVIQLLNGTPFFDESGRLIKIEKTPIEADDSNKESSDNKEISPDDLPF